MQKDNYDNIDDKMLNVETMHKIAIKINDATKVVKKLIIIINNENRFKHLIENSQFFMLLSINKINTFIFTMTKFIFKTENVDQLIQTLFDLISVLCAQVNHFFLFPVSINYFRDVLNAVITYFNSIFFEQDEKNV